MADDQITPGSGLQPDTGRHRLSLAGGRNDLTPPERLDGSGYPDGLKGDELTTEVRILGAVDVVEAMSTRRPYRSARSKGETLEEIRNGKENKYDPEVVEILIQMIEEGEIQFGGK